jgi:preprotein translocase subunit SecG
MVVYIVTGDLQESKWKEFQHHSINQKINENLFSGYRIQIQIEKILNRTSVNLVILWIYITVVWGSSICG